MPKMSNELEDMTNFEDVKEIIRQLVAETNTPKQTGIYPNPARDNPWQSKKMEEVGFKRDGIWFRPTLGHKIKNWLLFLEIKRTDIVNNDNIFRKNTDIIRDE